MKKDPSRQVVQPFGVPTAPVPFAPTAAVPFGMAPVPVAPFAFPVGAPVAFAPVFRVVHPIRYMERHTVTRHPIVHVYPSHLHHVHHDIYEHYCEYPHSASEECCPQKVDHCCPPPVPPC